MLPSDKQTISLLCCHFVCRCFVGLEIFPTERPSLWLTILGINKDFLAQNERENWLFCNKKCKVTHLRLNISLKTIYLNLPD